MKYFGLFLLLTSFQMLHAVEEKTIHVEGQMSRGTWMDFTSSTELNLKKLFELLARSTTGERLIKEADENCPVSNLLRNGLKIEITTALVQPHGA